MPKLAMLADLPQLEPRVVGEGDRKVCLVRVDDEVYVIPERCTHRPGPLAEGVVTWKRTLLCPWHLGTFDLRDGRVLAGPPTAPLAVRRAHVSGGEVWLEEVPG